MALKNLPALALNLENGRDVLDGEASALSENEDVKDFISSATGDARRSADGKPLQRRKRWLA